MGAQAGVDHPEGVVAAPQQVVAVASDLSCRSRRPTRVRSGRLPRRAATSWRKGVGTARVRASRIVVEVGRARRALPTSALTTAPTGVAGALGVGEEVATQTSSVLGLTAATTKKGHRIKKTG